MARPTVAWLAADPVAERMLDLAHRVLDAVKPDIDYLTGDLGWNPWKREGNSVPHRTLELITQAHCAMVIAGTQLPASEPSQSQNNTASEAYHYNDPWMLIARELHLFAELRPLKAISGNPKNHIESLDMVIFRDLLEGAGCGIGFHPITQGMSEILIEHPAGNHLSIFPTNEIALNARLITSQGIEKVLYKAFNFAQRNRRNAVTVIDQLDLFPETGNLIMETARNIALEFPGIPYRELSMTTAIRQILQQPEVFEVVVAENLFGDLLSRFLIELTGGTGFLCRVAMGNELVVVGPVLEGVDEQTPHTKINPFGTVTAVRMLLENLGDPTTASVLEKAVEQVISEGKFLPPEMGGESDTDAVVDAVIDTARRYLELT
jgi:3-isopropylmalate dehydrogenase